MSSSDDWQDGIVLDKSGYLPRGATTTYTPNTWQRHQLHLLTESANALGLKYTPETMLDHLIKLGWSMWGGNLPRIEITQDERAI